MRYCFLLRHFVYLLWITIPKQYKVPFFKKIEKGKYKESEDLIEVGKLFSWTKRERDLYKDFLEKI